MIKVFDFEKVGDTRPMELKVEQTHAYIEKHMLRVDYEAIMELNQMDDTGGLSNVIKGIDRHSYGLFFKEEKDQSVLFEVFYINYEKELIGYTLDLNISDIYWARYIKTFSVFLAKSFEILDPIETYNTFLKHTRTLLEKLDYFTLTLEDYDDLERKKGKLIVKNPKGPVIIPYENKIEVYKGIYTPSVENTELDDQNRVYLIYSSTQDLFKIGRSKNPKTRERTLQGQDPKLEILKTWYAPKTAETDLHRQFKSKRIRGEWFQLNLGDLVEIRDIMSVYN